MSYEVRPCASAEELRDAVRPISHYFGRSTPNAEQIDRVGRVLPVDRAHAAWDGSHVVGGASSFPFLLTVPGGRVGAAGISAVGVLPTHRRRGILRALMRAQLDDCRRRGEVVAYLWASEDTLYGRFGYGLASLSGEIELAREHTAYHPGAGASAEARLIALDEAEALIAPVYERLAACTPGMFARTPAWWQARVLDDPEWRRAGGGQLQCAVLDLGAGPAAYALYRVNFGSDRGVPTGAIDVIEAMGDSPESTAAIWRYLLDMDWTSRVKARFLPLDHPLFLLLAEPRRLRFSVRDGLWVRLVDVGAALTARSYQAGEPVVVEVADPFCPWNEGRWRLCATGAERTQSAAELRCDVTALGSVYLGGFTWSQLARALRVDAPAPSAITRADALFRTTIAPWCPEMF